MDAVDRRHTSLRKADVLVVGGGGAVAGLSGTICGMYEATDSVEAPPKQVVHGFLDTFVDAMDARGGLTPPLRYGKTFTRVHDPLMWRDTADALLHDAGVEVLCHRRSHRGRRAG